MSDIVLNGRRMLSEDKAAAYIFDMLEIPDYYPEDLDGIYDALVDIEGDVHLLVTDREKMETTSYGSRLIWIFEDAAEDNSSLQLEWEKSEDDDY